MLCFLELSFIKEHEKWNENYLRTFLPSPVLREIISSSEEQVSGVMKTALCFPAKRFKVHWTYLSNNIFQALGSSILHLLSNIY